MKNRLLLLCAIAAVSCATAVADRPSVVITQPGVGRAPDVVKQVPARVPSSSPGTNNLKAWEGFFSTNNLSTEQYLFTPNLADIAAGPTDILTIVNRHIARYANPNAVGSNPVPGPNAYPPTNEALLDAWLGETVLLNVCPTQPRSNISCLIDHASVRYDQMQGRFLVLMTATDTGVQTLGSLPVSPRKASWVLIVSKFATFTQGAVGSSDLFIPPTPPAGATGDVNTSNWTFYYGNSLNALGGDGFGNASVVNAGIGAGNINAIPGQSPTSDAMFNCNVPVPVEGTPVCYFPTSARLGIDNDNIIIASAVVNMNVPNPSVATPAFAGTRLRVIKKSALYTGKAPLAAGNQFFVGANQEATRAVGDYYDLYASDVPPAPLTVFPANVANSSYTFAPTSGIFTAGNGDFYEPAHVRGRPAASYSNIMLGPNSGFPTSHNYLMGTRSGGGVTGMRIQPILYRTVNPNNPANTNSSVAYYPTLFNNGSFNPPGIPGITPATIFGNANVVNQAAYQGTPGGPAAGTPAPALYVGDNRPQRVIFREGHLFDARVADIEVAGDSRVDGPRLSSTVFYDIVQQFSETNGYRLVFQTYWQNGQFWAPMFDVPANVVQSGQVSPINQQPWLEKLFVSTTFPPLTPTDPRVQPGGPQAGIANCTGAQPSVIAGIQTTGQSWPGLFDMRCGTDPYDTQQAFRDPVTGAIVTNLASIQGVLRPLPPVTLSTRGGASTDPNNGGLWLYGLYATRRFAGAPGAGQWGTYVANYDLSFPNPDPYNNQALYYNDVPTTHPFFSQIQIARQQGLTDPTAVNLLPDAPVLRAEMARLVMLSLMDEKGITAYLNATGGCNNSFADVATACSTVVSDPSPGPFPAVVLPTCTATLTTNCSGPGANPITNSFYWRYIEAMYRRGITKGCAFTDDALRYFCGDQTLTRGQMSVFLVRAKFSNVFPTVLNGCPAANIPTCGGGPGGDNFGLYVPTPGYFTDVPSTSDQYIYVQKMFELRITNGTMAPTFNPSGVLQTQGTYAPGAPLTRGQLLTFIVRSFFY